MNYELFKFFDQSFTVINAILIVLVIGSMIGVKKLIDNKLEPFLKNRELKFIGKERTMHKILMQLVWILGVFLFIGALGFGNKDFSLSNFFSYKLLSIDLGDKSDVFSLTVWKICVIVILVFITKLILNISKVVIFKATKGKDWIDEGRRFTILQLTKYFIYVFAIILGIRSLGFQVSSLIWASSGILLGLGLGLRDMFTDVVSGFILLFDGSVKVGDIVELGDMIAKVIKINIRTSHVKTMDGKIIVLPNSKLTEENVINWTISDKVTRFHIKVNVAYGSDTDKVRKLLYQCALDHPLVDKKRNVTIMFNDFGDNGLNFELYFWAARTWEIMIIKSDLRFAIDKAFRENDVRIPFPQRDLHIISDERQEL